MIDPALTITMPFQQRPHDRNDLSIYSKSYYTALNPLKFGTL